MVLNSDWKVLSLRKKMSNIQEFHIHLKKGQNEDIRKCEIIESDNGGVVLRNGIHAPFLLEKSLDFDTPTEAFKKLIEFAIKKSRESNSTITKINNHCNELMVTIEDQKKVLDEWGIELCISKNDPHPTV